MDRAIKGQPQGGLALSYLLLAAAAAEVSVVIMAVVLLAAVIVVVRGGMGKQAEVMGACYDRPTCHRCKGS